MKRIILLLLCASLCRAASVTIAESAYADASGRLATGTITISWPSFSNGVANIAAGSTTGRFTSGVLYNEAGTTGITLVANDTADPPFNYTASFRLSTASPYSQQWKVPTVAGPLAINAVTWSSNSPVTVGLDQIRRTGYFAGDIGYYNGTLWVRLPRGTNGQSLTIDTSLAGYLKWATISGSGGGTWGSITGTLSDQTDLGTALTAKLVKASNLSDLTSASTARTNLGLGTAAVSAASAFAATVHAHAASDVTSGVFDIARLATGTPNGAKFVRDDGVLATPAGGGDVVGPSSATDNAIPRYDSTTGKLLQNSLVTIDDSGNITTPGTISTGDGTAAGGPKMYEVTANGNNFRRWLVPDSLTADLTMTFPDAVPTAGQVMTFGAPSSNISLITFSTLKHQLVGVGGSSQTARGRINLIAGTNVTLTPSDNSGSDSLDLTIAATGGGSGSLPSDTGLGKQSLTSDGSGTAAWKPAYYYHPWSTGECVGPTPASYGMSFDASGGFTVICTGDGNKYLYGVVTTGSTATGYIRVPLPDTWTLSSTAALTVRFETSVNTGSTAIQVRSTCGAQTGSTFNTAATGTLSNPGTAFGEAMITVSSIAMTGCSAGQIATFKIIAPNTNPGDVYLLGGGIVKLQMNTY